jgi:ferrous-iron efflux pump FieF
MTAHEQAVAGHGKLMRRAAIAAVATGVFLVAVKLAAYIVTGSIAMLASLADSALDIIGSTVNLLAIRHALLPADREHRFGHGKAEPLAGLAQSAFIAGSATFLTVEAAERLFLPQPIENGAAGLVVMAISIVSAMALVALQHIVVKRTGSVAIDADRMHYLADILINFGVVAAIVLSTRFGMIVADPVIGLLVAGVLAYGSWHVFRVSYDQLMDREMPEAVREKIKAIVRRNPQVRALHDLRTRKAGMTSFIQFHIELDPGATLFATHAVADAVEKAVQAEFPNAEVIVHQDPAGLETIAELART